MLILVLAQSQVGGGKLGELLVAIDQLLMRIIQSKRCAQATAVQGMSSPTALAG